MSSEQDQERSQETPRSKIQSRSQQAAAVATRIPTPPTILIYVAVVFFTMLYGLVVPGEPTLAIDQRLAITIFLRLLLIFLLVNRSFVGWIMAVVYETLQIILVALLIEPPGGAKIWGMLFLHTAALALLLTGASRQHVWFNRGEPRPPGPVQTKVDEDEVRQADGTPSSSSSSSSSRSTD